MTKPREPRAGLCPSRLCGNIPRFRSFLVTLLNICCESFICRFMTCTISRKFLAIISSFATPPPTPPSGTQVSLCYTFFSRCLSLLPSFHLLVPMFVSL